MRPFWLVIILFICCQCKKDVEQQPHLSKQIENFTQVFVDYLQIMSSDTAKSEFQEKYLDQALVKNKMSREQFGEIYSLLKNNPEKASGALSAIIAGLQTLELHNQKQ